MGANKRYEKTDGRNGTAGPRGTTRTHAGEESEKMKRSGASHRRKTTDAHSHNEETERRDQGLRGTDIHADWRTRGEEAA